MGIGLGTPPAISGAMTLPQDLIGRTLQGRFTITELLGEGSMGIVYRGTDADEGCDVAIKVLQPELARHPEVVARFYREGSAARRIEHANTVRVFGRGEDCGVHYLVMELLEGRSLADVAAGEPWLGQVRAAKLVLQICGALQVAHARGIVHRDLKPENVMVLGAPGDLLGEHAKLLDFGIAKRVEADPSRPAGVEDSFNMEELTQCGALIGTPEYMAPEQCRGAAVDARTDIYACGVMLYRLVTGRVPFWAEHPLEICQLHLGEAPRPPSAVVPGIHPAIEAVILQAMSKAPADRQQSVVALAAQLERALDLIALEESEPTETLDRASLTALAPVATRRSIAPTLLGTTAAAPVTAPVTTPVAAPVPRAARTHVPVTARAGWRTHLPLVAAYATLCAGAVSLAITLTTLLVR
jgi:serine/threonine-protein kinase